MIIDLTTLINNIVDKIDINITYSFDDLKDTDIISLNNIKITGYISKNSVDDLYLDLNINGICVKPCALTLKPVDVKLDFKIEGLLSELFENYQNVEKTLDILPIIWENILVEVPNKVKISDTPEIVSGEGWRFITEEEKHINPELEKLNELLGKEVQ